MLVAVSHLDMSGMVYHFDILDIIQINIYQLIFITHGDQAVVLVIFAERVVDLLFDKLGRFFLQNISEGRTARYSNDRFMNSA